MTQASASAALSSVECAPIRAVIAIPARNEAARLPACLIALARQSMLEAGPSDIAVLVLANNCTDDTAALARRLAPSLPFRLIVQETLLSTAIAHAGGARRMAMDAAASLFGPGIDPRHAILLSTGADSRSDPGWLAANLGAFAAGADAVAGAITPDPEEAARLPSALRNREAKEVRYSALLDERQRAVRALHRRLSSRNNSSGRKASASASGGS